MNVARHAGLDPETALRRATERFTRRFGVVEKALGENLGSASLEQMEELWQRAKSEVS